MKGRIAVSTLLLAALFSPLVLGTSHLEPTEDELGSSGEHEALKAEGKRLLSAASTLDSIPSSLSDSALKIDSDRSAGLKDAPFDFKDGRPHTGPFVETSADRGRKKAKNFENDEHPDYPFSVKDSEEMPVSNDGVMDDPNRTGPKEGTRGDEGGVSEKVREKEQLFGSGPEKVPDPPREAPPLPHSEQEKVNADEASKKAVESALEDEGKKKEPGGLEKPEDLPEKPHDIPHPLPPSSKTDPLQILKPFTPSIPMLSTTDDTLIQPLHSFALSLIMIICSEIGDKTFLVAALMGMKHPGLVVFSAAFSALITMTILSAVFGHAVPSLISKKYTNLAAAILFLVFGLKMLREGYAIPLGQGVNEEMREVELELDEREEMARKMGRRRSSLDPYMVEAGRVGPRKGVRGGSRLPSPPASPPSSPDSRSPSPSRRGAYGSAVAGIDNLFSLLLSPAWVQTFVMTFLGEWGDRSQIATIAMAAGSDYWWVTGGAILGHGICTAGAVLGGKAIAGRVSLRVVTLCGGFAFLAFGIIYLFEARYMS